MNHDTASFSPAPSSAISSAYHRLKRWRNVLLFVGGFLFDVVTLNRIDSWLDLAAQLAYLLGLTVLLVGQYRHEAGHWQPGRWLMKVWHYNVEALHFFYGGLLSNYVVFYAKSGSGLRPLVFFGLLVVLMFLNEMPAVRRLGHRLRLGLYAFCVASFLIYFLPVVLGSMGDGIFCLSMLLASLTVWGVTALLARAAAPEERRRRRLALAWPAGAVVAAITLLYFFRLVPPVPLSVQFHGVYHEVRKEEGAYHLRALLPPFWRFWQRDDRPYLLRPGDQLYYFARVFAPRHFHHRIAVRWEQEDPGTGRFVTRAVVPILIAGGRDQGFRAFSYFDGAAPGLWRAGVETEDGRPVGRLSFQVKADAGEGDRRWAEWVM